MKRAIEWILDKMERFVGSYTVQMCCVLVVGQKLVRMAGLGFDEFFLLAIAFVGFGHRIRVIEAAVTQKPIETGTAETVKQGSVRSMKAAVPNGDLPNLETGNG